MPNLVLLAILTLLFFGVRESTWQSRKVFPETRTDLLSPDEKSSFFFLPISLNQLFFTIKPPGRWNWN